MMVRVWSNKTYDLIRKGKHSESTRWSQWMRSPQWMRLPEWVRLPLIPIAFEMERIDWKVRSNKTNNPIWKEMHSPSTQWPQQMRWSQWMSSPQRMRYKEGISTVFYQERSRGGILRRYYIKIYGVFVLQEFKEGLEKRIYTTSVMWYA